MKETEKILSRKTISRTEFFMRVFALVWLAVLFAFISYSLEQSAQWRTEHKCLPSVAYSIVVSLTPAQQAAYFWSHISMALLVSVSAYFLHTKITRPWFRKQSRPVYYALDVMLFLFVFIYSIFGAEALLDYLAIVERTCFPIAFTMVHIPVSIMLILFVSFYIEKRSAKNF
jgi:hypothetical protein